jgi:hypothetical protein
MAGDLFRLGRLVPSALLGILLNRLALNGECSMGKAMKRKVRGFADAKHEHINAA